MADTCVTIIKTKHDTTPAKAAATTWRHPLPRAGMIPEIQEGAHHETSELNYILRATPTTPDL